MKIISRPFPIDKEIILDPGKTIMSKTDEKGIIEYANEYFMEISRYKEWELMGQPHSIIRHPDMPRVVFQLLWDRLHEGKNINPIVKNLAKDGSYYWVIADFETKYNDEGEIIAHYSRRKSVPHEIKPEIEKLYKSLVAIEKNGGMEASKAYFGGFLEDLGMSFDAYILSLIGLSKEELHAYMYAEIPSDGEILDTDQNLADDFIKKNVKKKGFIKKIFG